MTGSGTFNPYPGLRSFEPDEDHLFFGREKQIDDLLKRLRKNRFLSVVGTSGSGKSSVIRSGLIPALYSGMMTRAGSSWRIAIMRPGDDPIGNLAEVLNDPDVLGPEDEEMAPMNRSILETTLRSSAVGLADAVRQSGIDEHENMLVVADQFEELFRFKETRKDSRREALAFVRLLLEGARSEGVPVYVVITMRSDFIGNCMDFPGLPEAVNDSQYLIPRMTRDELKMAITGPAAVAGGAMSPRLVRTLLNEVGDNPDQLPILQHSLMRMWDYWQEHHADDEAVDLEHYAAIGTMKGALSRHAEEAYGELENDREREIAEKMWKALTDKGRDARGTRRPCRVSEICAQTGAEPHEVVAVADRFRKAGRSFLMPPADVELDADSVLDISHESLMRVWTRLIDWLDEEGRSAQLYRRLSRAAARHEAGEGGLWREEELALAVPWYEKTKPTEAWARRYDPDFERAMAFLDESQRERDAFLARKEAYRKRKLERARRLNWAAAVVAVLVLGFALNMWRLSLAASTQSEVVLAQKAYAEKQQRIAEQKEREAERQRLAAERLREVAIAERSEANEQRLRAEEQQQIAEQQRLLALSKERQALANAQQAQVAREQAEVARAEAEASRRQALQQKEEADAARLQAEKAEAEAQRLRRLAQFREIVFQTLQSGERKGDVAALVAVQALRLYRQLGSTDEDPHVFDVLRRNAERLGSERWDVLASLRGPARALAVSSDGSKLAAGGEDSKLRLVSLAGAATGLPALKVGRSGVRALAFGNGGTRLSVAGGDGSLRVFDLGQPRPSFEKLEEPGAAVTALAARRDVPVLASGGANGDLWTWDLDRLTNGERLTAAPSTITSLAFRGETPILAIGSLSGGVRLVDTESPEAEVAILAGGGDVRAVAASVDGRHLAAGFGSGQIQVWDLSAPGEPAHLEGHALPVNSVAFDPAGTHLVSASDDGSARIWDLGRPEIDPLLVAHGGRVTAAVFSADGETVITAGDDSAIRQWPRRTDQLADEICRLVSRNLSRAEWQEYLPEYAEYEATCPNLPPG